MKTDTPPAETRAEQPVRSDQPDQRPGRSRASGRLLLTGAVLFTVAVAIAAGVLLGRQRAAVPAGAPAAAAGGAGQPALSVQPAPPLALADQTGRTVALSALHGRPVVVTFLDPLCTEMCPIVGAQLAQLQHTLPAASQPVIVAVSVAPGRTPAQAAAFAAHAGWRPGSWHFLLGPPAALPPAWAAWHVTVQPEPTDIVHDALVDVIDPQGRLRAVYGAPLPVSELATVVTTAAKS